MRGDIIPPRRPDVSPQPRQKTPMAQPQAISKEVSRPLPKAGANDATSLDSAVSAATSSDATVPPHLQTHIKNRSRRTQLLTIFGGLVALILISTFGAFMWYNNELKATKPGSAEKIKVTIQAGASPADIATLLKKSDLIRNSAAFSLYVRLEGKSGSLQSGAYRLSKADDVQSIVKHLTSGNTDTFSITFLPGATIEQNRQVLIKAGYTAQQVNQALQKNYDNPIFEGKPDGTDLEGYIYGETYDFAADATPEQILTRTFDQFEKVAKKENLTELYKQRGFSLYQGITLASIIQREVATASDSAQVAQVFELRLKSNTQLGSDVTYQYIADKTGQTRSVDIDSPYNTRRYKGLPPGPISAPGLAALKAVGSPAPGDYLFFISGDDDKTYFAHTNDEHEKNIQQHCQKKCQII